MKKLILFSLSFLCTLGCFAQFESAKQVFSIDGLKDSIYKHKTVAILPYAVTITYKKQPKNFSAEANRQQEISMAKNIQSSMYTYLLRKRDKYSVEFQDVDKTNLLLKRNNMLNLEDFTKDEIAAALGVDAVIGGKFDIEQTKSEGAAIATAVLLGGAGGKTGTGSLTMTINSARSGELLWRFFKTMDEGIMNSTDDLVERMMRKVARNFPYETD